MTTDPPPDRSDETRSEPVPDDPDSESVPVLLGSARSRRIELGEAADTIESRLARPASDPMWSARVAEALEDLRSAFEHHVDEVERPDGLLPQLLDDQPRLANGVSRLYSEHGEIDLRLNEVADLICLCSPDCDHTVIDAVRTGTVDVLSRISLHRQAGADIVYEAYHVDIGGG